MTGRVGPSGARMATSAAQTAGRESHVAVAAAAVAAAVVVVAVFVDSFAVASVLDVYVV